ncbi:hypothetical protein [Dermatobacter hominis]|uniref:hypothetical protein n=1 Tax=Dermatobacter hominis TaxID=2884263 RepID=UPI001D1100D4|nr:hypothetical protein [Dermatobacter hominis]UDY35940.1 hypothetical protein LH044_00010 [Dermatobacter hominis]
MAGSDRPQTAAEARAEVEARRAEVRAERRAAFEAAYGDAVPGRWVVIASWATTALFTIGAVLGVVAPDGFDLAFLVLSLVLFALGCLLFVVDLVLAANRSREAAMGIGGLFFLAGSAPTSVQRHLMGSLAVQVVVSIAAAAVGFSRLGDRDLNALAFGILVPMAGLGWSGLWGVRWGLFPDRVEPDRPSAARVADAPRAGGRRR